MRCLDVKVMLKTCVNDAGHPQIHRDCVVDDRIDVEKVILTELPTLRLGVGQLYSTLLLGLFASYARL